MGKYWTWLKLNTKKDIRLIKNHIDKFEIYEWLLFLYLLLYNLYFTYASFRRYDVFHAGRYDLGNMAQTVWNTAQGRIFVFTDPNGTESISRLAYHADVILVFLAPFYMIWDSPKVLLIIQSLVLSLGAAFIYLISKNVTKHKLISFVFAISFLLNPSVQRVNLYDFHAVAFATTFLLACFYFIQKENYKYFLLFSFLAGITKEQVWVIVGLMGFYIALRKIYRIYLRHNSIKLKFLNTKTIKFGIIFGLISLLIFYVAVSEIIPLFRMGDHFALNYFAALGSSPSQIIVNTFTKPYILISIITQKPQADYLVQILSPLGFISLLAPQYLIFALPDLLINLMSSNKNLHQIYYQYTSTITPFIYISAIYGAFYLNKFIPLVRLRYLSIFLILTSLHSAYLYGPLWFSKSQNITMLTQTPRGCEEEFKSLINSIPDKGLVSASNSLGAHFSNRQSITTLPVAYDLADYVFFNLRDGYASPSLNYHKFITSNLKSNPNYVLLYDKCDFVAFKKIK